ncbi:unnamed protein product, partial [Thlaspi arvense]
MNRIRFLDVASAITIILLLVIADQANAIDVTGECFGPCNDNCESTCKKN